MIVELSDNGIKYEWGLEGRGGMTVMLYPVKGQHSQADITEAKKQLREDLDVTYVTINWVTQEQSKVLLKPTIVAEVSTENIHELMEG